MGEQRSNIDSDIRELLNVIVNQNNEIKKDIEQIKSNIATQCLKIDVITDKVSVLEQENKDLRTKLISLEKRLKRNNIIIYGIPENIIDLLTFVVGTITNTLEVNITNCEINNIHRIGQKQPDKIRPVILELVTNLKKQEIFKQTSKLKNTGIVFSNDLTPEDREEQKVLRHHLNEARKKQYNAKIVKNKLIINGDTYSYHDLKEKNLEDIGYEKQIINETRKVNSEPTTPSVDDNVFMPYLDTRIQTSTEKRQQEPKGKAENKVKNVDCPLRGSKRINNIEEKELTLRSHKKSKN